MLITVLVNAIYLYDDKITLVLNVGDDQITIDSGLLDEIEQDNEQVERSYDTKSGSPRKPPLVS